MAAPYEFNYQQAVIALVIALRTRVQHEFHSFVRADWMIREGDAAKLLGRKPGTLARRELLGKLRLPCHRDGDKHRWFSLFDIARHMLGPS
ncbi:hypothetical protein [Paraburkholderia saeva]|uniref:Uncharacterized protein n=1 Tax=Paraburkholderia saeva TaxID=2777537 RepID=A0A9N8X2Y7_9BURK|nr:hypothetical protein [Paraburkholderia saeva]CAG4905707.1 hypothetical protein LMG31841_03478 [Paraburkholderia saeva]